MLYTHLIRYTNISKTQAKLRTMVLDLMRRTYISLVITTKNWSVHDSESIHSHVQFRGSQHQVFTFKLHRKIPVKPLTLDTSPPRNHLKKRATCAFIFVFIMPSRSLYVSSHLTLDKRFRSSKPVILRVTSCAITLNFCVKYIIRIGF